MLGIEQVLLGRRVNILNVSYKMNYNATKDELIFVYLKMIPLHAYFVNQNTTSTTHISPKIQILIK